MTGGLLCENMVAAFRWRDQWKVDGACHCGRIAFEAQVDENEVSICHCDDCQRLTGTAFRVSVAVPAENFHLLRGSPRKYIKTAESGARRLQGFCGDGGSPLFATSADKPEVYGLRVGTLLQRDQLVPRKQIWRHLALHWVPLMEHLETWSDEDDFPSLP